jgi:hypothetical protein
VPLTRLKTQSAVAVPYGYDFTGGPYTRIINRQRYQHPGSSRIPHHFSLVSKSRRAAFGLCCWVATMPAMLAQNTPIVQATIVYTDSAHTCPGGSVTGAVTATVTGQLYGDGIGNVTPINTWADVLNAGSASGDSRNTAMVQWAGACGSLSNPVDIGWSLGPPSGGAGSAQVRGTALRPMAYNGPWQLEVDIGYPANASYPFTSVQLALPNAVYDSSVGTISVTSTGLIASRTSLIVCFTTQIGGSGCSGGGSSPSSDPVLSSVSPNSAPAGSPATYITVAGSDFATSATITWTQNGTTTGMPTFVPSSTSAETTVPAPYLTTAGTVQVTVRNPDGTQSSPLPFTIAQPGSVGPEITSLNPSAAAAGSSAVTLTVTGSNFSAGAVVKWTANGQTTNLSTQFVSATSLTAAIPSGFLASPGTAEVTVANSTGSPSGAASFAISASGAPDLALGKPTFESDSTSDPNGYLRSSSLAVDGNTDGNYSDGSVTHNGVADPNAYWWVDLQGSYSISSIDVWGRTDCCQDRLDGATVSVFAAGQNPDTSTSPVWTGQIGSVPGPSGTTQLAGAFIPNVTGQYVKIQLNPSSDGYLSLAEVQVFGNAAAASAGPVISSLNPNSAPAGSSTLSLTVTGSNFVNGCLVKWTSNGQTTNLGTQFVNATTLTASIPSALLAAAAAAQITVSNPTGNPSASLPFTITAPGAFSFSNQRVAKVPISNGVCSPPPAVSSFLTTDQNVYLYYNATVTQADVLHSDWLAPDGSVVGAATAQPESGSVCYGGPLAIGNLPRSQLGSWLARVYHIGSLLFTVPFTVSSPGATAITSVSAVAPQQTQNITISGTGFGSQPPYSGESPYLEISDLTGSWNAGYTDDLVGVQLSSWTDTQIQIQGFQGSYGQHGWVLRAGDQLQVQVWNPQTNATATYQLSVTSTSPGGASSLYTYYLTHVADGGGWQTILNVMNPSSSSVNYQVQLRSDNGSPMTITAGPQTGSSFSGSLAANGSATYESSGPPNLSEGIALVTANQALVASGIFSNSTPGQPNFEAAVPAFSPPVASLILPFDNQNGNTTGLALANTGNADATVSVEFLDSVGATTSTGQLTLSAGTKTEFVLPSQFPQTVGQGGTVVFSTEASALTALGLRFLPSHAFTSLPAYPTSSGFSSNLPRQVLSHVIDGGGWRSTITLVNTNADQPATYQLGIFDTSGDPLSLNLNGTVAATFSGSVPPLSAVTLVSPGTSSNLVQGWADVIANQGLEAQLMFDELVSGQAAFEATVPSFPDQQTALAMPYDNTGGLVTGIAVANSGGSPASVQLTARDQSGAVTDTQTLNLAAGAKTSFTLTQMAPNSAGKSGMVQLTTANSSIAALALRFNGPAFTTLPVVAMSSGASSNVGGSAPVINSFAADSTTITAGGSTTLRWNVSGATSVSINNGVGSVAVGSGSIQVSPAQTTTYTLTASNAAGQTPATVTVSVTAPTSGACSSVPPTIQWPYVAQKIEVGMSATLRWVFTSCFNTVTISPGIGAVAISGSLAVSPTQTTTYTFTATSAVTSTVTYQVTVPVVPQASISSFTATPSSIADGQPSLLQWVTANANWVTISPPYPYNPNGYTQVQPSGSLSVSSAQTTTYTLTAVGLVDDNGRPVGVQVTKTVTVTVNATSGGSPGTIPAAGVSCDNNGDKWIDWAGQVTGGFGPQSHLYDYSNAFVDVTDASGQDSFQGTYLTVAVGSLPDTSFYWGFGSTTTAPLTQAVAAGATQSYPLGSFLQVDPTTGDHYTSIHARYCGSQ